jgi:integrase/recombinase XerD
MRSSSIVLGQHLHTFFHDYLVGQRRVSDHTVLAYRDALKLLLRFAVEKIGKKVDAVTIEDLGPDTVLAFLNHLEKTRKNTIATRNARLAALHVFYRHVAARDPTSFQLCQRVLGIPVKRAETRTIHYLARDEMDAILAQIDRSKGAGLRDYVILAFAYQTGARVQEIVALRACDLRLDRLAQVNIWGKGRKERVVPLWARTATLLRAWLDDRQVDPRSTSLVFTNQHGRPLTRWGVRYILKKHARAAAAVCPSIAQKRIHPHVIRHTMAVHMLESGAATSDIRDLLGHESAETTWRYTRVGIERKRRIIESSSTSHRSSEEPVPIWRRDPDLLAQLEAIGRVGAGRG